MKAKVVISIQNAMKKFKKKAVGSMFFCQNAILEHNYEGQNGRCVVLCPEVIAGS
ncbi:MAG: hypothetical protein IJ537_07290 [Bacteroidaceae bacterium]|nr:hypothetical protein [Bacteroidaceae bacterium]